MKRRVGIVALTLAFWTLLGLVFAAQTYLSAAILAHPIPWRYALAYALPGWYIWAALAPLVAWLARKVPLAQPQLLFGVVFHLTASALLSLLHTLISVALMFVTMPAVLGTSFVSALRFHIQLGTHLNLLTYWTILAVAHAAAYYRAAQQRELRATQLAAGLTQARLDALRMELNPHFLFNTLNTIASLIYTDQRAADQMIAQLGELLRMTLQTRNRPEVTLEEEMRYVRSYVSIEQIRFGERLDVAFDVDLSARVARVPSLLLQPLVENAIRHGIDASSARGSVRVQATRDADQLRLVVADSGAAGTAHSANGLGIGLSNTRERLRHMYGEQQSLHVATDALGSVVTVTIPFRATEEELA